jgi:hypothetical protein
LTSNISAQDSNDIDFQTWTDLTTIYSLNSRWMYSGDYGIRGVVSGQDWYTFYMRPTFQYYPTSILNVRAGVAMMYTRDPVTDNQLEIRFHQEANLKWPEVTRFVFRHMVRFEERFFYYKLLESDISTRGRYRFTVETPDFKVFKIKNPFYALGNVEIFIPLGLQSTERYINNKRLLAGIGHRLHRKFRYEVHYIWQRSRNYREEELKESEHILRLRMFLTLKTL